MINFTYQIVRYMQIESLFSQMAEHTKDDLMDSPSTTQVQRSIESFKSGPW